MPARGRIDKVAKLALAVVFGFLVSTGPAAFAQAKDALIGTWILDLGRSSFVPDNPPQKRVIQITAKDDAVRFVIRTTASGGLDNGMVSESEFNVKYDGKDHEISESILDTVSLKKIDANTIERSGKIPRGCCGNVHHEVIARQKDAHDYDKRGSRRERLRQRASI